MQEGLTQLGVGGIFVVLVLKEVVVIVKAALGRRNGNGQGHEAVDAMFKLVREIRQDADWLRQAHDEKDDDGVYTFKVRRSLWKLMEHIETAMTRLSLSQERQAIAMETLARKIGKSEHTPGTAETSTDS
jgi:hypothetical protein